MGLGSWLAKRLDPEQAERNKNILQALYAYASGGASIMSYTNFNQLIKEGFQRNVDLYSVVNWTAENAAKVPLRVRVNGDLAPNHELQKLIDKPNPYQSGLEQRHQIFGFYQVTGNSFLQATRNEGGMNVGKASELWVMPTQYTRIHTGGWKDPITGYSLTMGNTNYEIPFNDVMHMKALTLEFGGGQEFWGMSPLQAGLLSLDRSNSNYVYSAQSFKNGGISGILQAEREEFAPNLSAEQQEQAEQRLQDRYRGVFNNGKTMVTNAEVKWHQMGFSPVDLDLLQDKRATLRDFCNIYGVSSTLFNDNENSTYNNVSEAKKSAYNDSIIPLVDRYVQEFNEWIVGSYGSNVEVFADYSEVAVLQTDKAEQSKWLTEQVKTGQMTLNESREIQGLEPDPNPLADQLLVSSGTMLLSDVAFDPFIETSEEAKKAGKHYLDK